MLWLTAYTSLDGGSVTVGMNLSNVGYVKGTGDLLSMPYPILSITLLNCIVLFLDDL